LDNPLAKANRKRKRAYRLFERGQRIEKIIEQEIKKLDCADADVPDNLGQRINEMLGEDATHYGSAAHNREENGVGPHRETT
jgi:hypothetical protein